MKKTIVILVIVAAVTTAVYFADKATRVHVSATARPTAGLKAGAAAPDFSVKDMSDKNVSFEDYKGKVVLVNFWATWCTPCQEEIPELIAMQDKYGSKGFTVLGLAMDEEGKSIVAPFVAKERYDVGGQKLPMNYPIVIGNDSVAEKFGGLLGLPTSVLVSRDGKVLKRVTGIINEEDISKQIEGAL